ncbi:MAG: hydrogenase maturation protease [Rhodomicrobium sp.]
MSRILVAGIGNIFKGDDGFGVEVARRLARRRLPDAVKVTDFGIRGIDLTYALLDGYNAAILIDTLQRGLPPGTISIVEPDRPAAGELGPEALLLEPHNLDPAKVLALVSVLGGGCQRILLVACEPETFGDEEIGAMGLSRAVAAAAGEAVPIVERLIGELLKQSEPTAVRA